MLSAVWAEPWLRFSACHWHHGAHVRAAQMKLWRPWSSRFVISPTMTLSASTSIACRAPAVQVAGLNAVALGPRRQQAVCRATVFEELPATVPRADGVHGLHDAHGFMPQLLLARRIPPLAWKARRQVEQFPPVAERDPSNTRSTTKVYIVVHSHFGSSP